MRASFERSAMVLPAVLVAGSGLACTNESDTPPGPTSGTTLEQIGCDPGTDALIDFAYTEDTVEDVHDDPLLEIAEWIDAQPDLAPQALIDAYIADWETQNASTGLRFAFDDGVIPEAWESEPRMGNAQRQVYIGRVDNLLRTLNEYPRELFAAIGVTSVRVADQYETYAGHFHDGADEILVEFDAFGNDGASLDTLREIVAHEVFGHAAHSAYCQGLIEADGQIEEKNEGFEYLGYPPDDSSPEEFGQFYEQVPLELLKYGPERMFARAYGATSVAEDVATIVEFTLEMRGLIREGDEDFGSPLYYKQQEIVDRMDDILPGFRIFAELRTVLLRTNPHNEVNLDRAQRAAVPPEFAPEAASYNTETGGFDFDLADEDTVNVLNGAIYFPYEKARGGTLGFYPILNINPAAEIAGIRLQDERFGILTDSIGEDEELRFYGGELGEPNVVQMTYAEWQALVSGDHDRLVSQTVPNTFMATDPQPYIYRRTAAS